MRVLHKKGVVGLTLFGARIEFLDVEDTVFLDDNLLEDVVGGRFTISILIGLPNRSRELAVFDDGFRNGRTVTVRQLKVRTVLNVDREFVGFVVEINRTLEAIGIEDRSRHTRTDVHFTDDLGTSFEVENITRDGLSVILLNFDGGGVLAVFRLPFGGFNRAVVRKGVVARVLDQNTVAKTQRTAINVFSGLRRTDDDSAVVFGLRSAIAAEFHTNARFFNNNTVVVDEGRSGTSSFHRHTVGILGNDETIVYSRTAIFSHHPVVLIGNTVFTRGHENSTGIGSRHLHSADTRGLRIRSISRNPQILVESQAFRSCRQESALLLFSLIVKNKSKAAPFLEDFPLLFFLNGLQFFRGLNPFSSHGTARGKRGDGGGDHGLRPLGLYAGRDFVHDHERPAGLVEDNLETLVHRIFSKKDNVAFSCKSVKLHNPVRVNGITAILSMTAST